MTYFSLFYLLLGCVYAIILLYFLTGIYRIKRKHNTDMYPVSILVPARNEEDNILNCLTSLDRQTYPRNLYEVIVIDDGSTDHTATIVEKYIENKSSMRLIKHKVQEGTPTFKKHALAFGIGHATGEIIMTIDADTRAQPGWIQEMVNQYDGQTGLVAGLITFDRASEKNIFHKLQTLEFAGLVFCGVGSMGNNNPVICNGANLSYRRRVFDEVGGFEGHDHLPSGDDDLLLQNIHRRTDWKVSYLLDYDTINFTKPMNGIKNFLNQRSRWASKSIHYPSKGLFAVMLSIYLFYSLLFSLLPFTLLGLFTPEVYLAGLLLKVIPEFLIISKALGYLKRKDLLPLFFLAEFLQIPYVLYAGFMGFFHKFRWKGYVN